MAPGHQVWALSMFPSRWFPWRVHRTDAQAGGAPVAVWPQAGDAPLLRLLCIYDAHKGLASNVQDTLFW